MKLGVLTVPLYGMPAEEAFRYLSGLGVQTVEIGVGGYPGNTHLDPAAYLGDDGKIAAYRDLIESCGLKGYRSGGAQVAERHAGFIINTGGATAKDVLQLIRHIQKTVRERHGVNLQLEIKLLGAIQEG